MTTKVAKDTKFVDLFDVYPEVARAAQLQLVAPEAAKSDFFKKQFFAVAGNFVVPSPPRQMVSDLHTIRELSLAATPEIMHIVLDLKRKSNAVGLILPQDKLDSRANEKAREDYDGDLSRVCDFKRFTIEVDKDSQIKSLSNMLNPARNSSVVRFENTFQIPDQNGGLPCIKTNLRASNGHVWELQIRHSAMEKIFHETSGLYAKIRTADIRLTELFNKGDTDGYQIVSESREKMQRERVRKHSAGVQENGLDRHALERHFYCVGGFPVMEVCDYSGEIPQYEAVIPDMMTGKFVTDNRFLAKLTDPNSDTKKIPREIFMARSMALVTSHQAKSVLQLVA